MRYNGVDLREANRALSVSKEIPPGMPDRSNEMVQGQGGEILAASRISRGEYTVRVNVSGKTRQEAWEARAALAAWADTKGQTAPLEPSLWPGKAYDAVVKSIDPPEFKFGFGVIKVAFDIPRPIAYDIIEDVRTGSKTITMVVGGTSYCRPVIRQTMAAAASRLTMAADGSTFLVLNRTLKAGDVVTVDLKNESVLVNGEHAEASIDYTSTYWRPGFDPGPHTVTSSDSGAIEARWHNEWL